MIPKGICRLAAIVGGVVLLAGPGAGLAYADWIDDLPKVDAGSIQPRILDLDPRVLDLDPRITDWVEERREGSDTVLDLSADLLFKFGSAKVNDPAARRLPELLEPIPKGARVEVYGHTDGIGSTKSNLKLSKARAKAVAAVIAADRPDLKLDVRGFGESAPRVPETSGGEDDPSARAKNRRVEVRYQS